MLNWIRVSMHYGGIILRGVKQRPTTIIAIESRFTRASDQTQFNNFG